MIGLIGALLVGGFFGLRELILPWGANGRCFVLSDGACVELSRERIEQVSGISLPADAQVVESSSRGMWGGGTAYYARIRLPSPSIELFDDRYDAPESRCHLGDLTYLLNSLSLIEVDRRSFCSSQVVNTAIVANAADGTMWLLISVRWDGRAPDSL